MPTIVPGRLGPKSLPFVGALICSLLLVFVHPAAAAKWVSGELLVQYRAGADQAAMAQEFKNLGASLEKEIDRIKVKRIKVSEANREKIKARLAKNPQVEFVEENFLAQGMLIPSDSVYASQWHLPKIAAPQAWDTITGSVDFPIAIIDSGVDADHPDLAGKLVAGYNYLTGGTATEDVLGHGTSVAGSAGAISNNALGVAGVAWENPIMPLLVLDSSNSASYSNIASAIIYAADHGAKVINISIAGSSSSYTLQNAVNYAWGKGVVIIAAAANYSTSTPYYPAACANVVAVSATTSSDTLASFSNFGSWIDLAAPGSYIYTTNRGGGYGAWNGTSFSSPIVAGVAGVVWAANPSLTNAEVVDILEQGADDLGSTGFDTSFGFGRVNAANSVALAQKSTTNQDRTAPEVAVVSPSDGATVSGTTVVSVSASDNLAVARVELLIDGTVYSVDTTEPYSFTWDTTKLADGWYTLSTIAYDAAGNVGESDVIMVQVSDPTITPETTVDTEAPTAIVVSPSDGTTVSGATVVSVSASDNQAVGRVYLLIDGSTFSSDSTAPYSFTWDTTGFADGGHRLTAVVYDEALNVGRSAEVVVQVSNSTSTPDTPVDTEAPTVSIASPSDGATVSGTTVVSVSASDNQAVGRVYLLIDGSTFSSDSTAPYSFTWDTTGFADGGHRLTAVVYDEALNVGRSAEVVVQVSNPTSTPDTPIDTEAPTVTFISPVYGTAVPKKMLIDVQASDNVGVNRIELYIDGTLRMTSDSGTLRFVLNTVPLEQGDHELKATVYDEAGNVNQASIVIKK